VLQAAIDTLPSLSAVRLSEVRCAPARGHLRLDATVGGTPLVVLLEPARPGASCLFRLGPFAVSHERDTPLRHPDEARTLRRLIEAFVRLAGRVAPELLPDADGGTP
jgi:hypothetical protein